MRPLGPSWRDETRRRRRGGRATVACAAGLTCTTVAAAKEARDRVRRVSLALLERLR